MRTPISTQGRALGVVLACAAFAGGLLSGPATASPQAPLARPTTPVTAPDDGRSAWRVTADPEGARLQWRSPTPIPVVDARVELRVDGAVVAYPVVSADGRRVSVPLAEVSAQDLARAQLWLGGRRLDGPTPTGDATRVPSPPVGPTVSAPADLGRPGPFEVETRDYRRANLPQNGYRSPLEVLGHAVLPVGAENAPLVLFLHGRHQACYGRGDNGGWPCAGQSRPVPSHLGYDYLQRMLASQGYATVSIAANAVNAQDALVSDAGASARSALVRHHLGLLAGWTQDAGMPAWTGRLDLDQVVLVGHSRGGEGVNQAAIETVAGAPYRLRGQVLLGATDFMYQTAGYLPTVSVLPYCDGDVFDLQAQRYVDAAATLTRDDPSLRSSVLLRGANHNYFNSEWTPGISQAPSFDDWGQQSHPLCGRRGSPTRLTPLAQRATAKVYTQASVEAFIDADQGSVDVLDAGLPVRMPQADDAIAWTHAIGGNRDTVRLGAGATPRGAARACRAGRRGGGFFERTALCSVGLPYARQVHWTPDSGSFATVGSAVTQAGLPEHLRFTWAGPGVSGGFTLDAPLDLADAGSALDLRVIADPRRARQRFGVRVTDGDGTSWTAPVSTLRRLPGEAFLTAVWAQTVRIDVDGAPADLDLSDVRAIALSGVSAEGSLWVLDASARRTGLADVPPTLLPSIRLRDVTVLEGDSPRRRVARMPFTVRGEVTRPVRVAIAMEQGTFGGDRVEDRFLVLRVAPGQTSGFLDVPYEADALDDDGRQLQNVYAVPLRGVGVAGGPRRVVVVDDDPAAGVRLAARRSPVQYGQAMRFDVRRDGPSDRYVFVRLKGVRTPGARQLRVQDVPARWLREQLGEVPPPGPLAPRLRFIGLYLEPDRPRASFEVPLQSTRGPVVTRALTLRARAEGLVGAAEVTIRARG